MGYLTDSVLIPNNVICYKDIIHLFSKKNLIHIPTVKKSLSVLSKMCSKYGMESGEGEARLGVAS